MNEAILVREGIIKWHFANTYDHENSDVGAANRSNYASMTSSPENMFSTENYLNGNYNVQTGSPNKNKKGDTLGLKGGYTLDDGSSKAPMLDAKTKKPIPRDPYQLQNYDPVYANESRLGSRAVKMEDGILLPKYRLPTEAEWEFAALGLIGNLDPDSENIDSRRIYPWDGHYVRRKEDQWAGAIQANFIRGNGDYMGVSGALNDGADVTARVDDFWPNDYGLYHMAGNVSEWVMDVYRPTSNEESEDFMPFRGNVYTTQLLRPDGLYDKPVLATDNLYDVYGMKEYVNEFARAKYLSLTGGTKAVNDLNKKNDPSYVSNYIKENPNQYVDYKVESGNIKEMNGLWLVLKGDSVKLNASSDKLNAIKKPFSWETSDAQIMGGSNQDTNVVISFPNAGDYAITLNQENDYKETKKFKVFGNKKEFDDYINYVNSTRGQILGNSRQNPRKFQFNAPKDGYVYGYNKYSKNDSIEFRVLDDINGVLDTAIYLYNQGNATKASHYLEVALFGNLHKADVLAMEDYRKGHFEGKVYGNADEEIKIGVDEDNADVMVEATPLSKVGIYYIDKLFEAGSNDPSKQFLVEGKIVTTSVFSDDYLEYRFKNYKQDPNITAWILTLRNGLTEFVNETRGQQRWRNVTEDENAGRLNYRKDDYINYLDGDLESSIYYNNQKKIDDINNGRRDSKQAVYQSEFENFDLKGSEVNVGVSGWPTTLVSDKSRVYKGGSWSDRAFWLSPGSRRFLDEEQSTAMIGFRCAMDRLGSTRANSKKK